MMNKHDDQLDYEVNTHKSLLEELFEVVLSLLDCFSQQTS